MIVLSKQMLFVAIIVFAVTRSTSARMGVSWALWQTPLPSGNFRRVPKTLAVRGGSTVGGIDHSGVGHLPLDGESFDPESTKMDKNADEGSEEVSARDEFAKIPNELVRLIVQTNWGNSILDHCIELTSKRSKTIVELKKSVSRLLPGRPPVLGLDLVYEGRVLDDDMLIDELYDGDYGEVEEVEEDGENQGLLKILTLNSVPPVDPKFAVELAPRLSSHVEDDEDTLTTEEMVEAFFLNLVAMARNARLLSDPKAPFSPVVRLEIQGEATELKEKFKSEVAPEVWESSLKAIKRDHSTEEIRGQRYRSGKGGARTSLKKSIQTSLNIVR